MKDINTIAVGIHFDSLIAEALFADDGSMRIQLSFESAGKTIVRVKEVIKGKYARIRCSDLDGDLLHQGEPVGTKGTSMGSNLTEPSDNRSA